MIIFTSLLSLFNLKLLAITLRSQDVYVVIAEPLRCNRVTFTM